jgi:hypothetical protein
MITINGVWMQNKKVTQEKEFFIVGVTEEWMKIIGSKGAQQARIAKNLAEKESDRVIQTKGQIVLVRQSTH